MFFSHPSHPRTHPHSLLASALRSPSTCFWNSFKSNYLRTGRVCLQLHERFLTSGFIPNTRGLESQVLHGGAAAALMSPFFFVLCLCSLLAFMTGCDFIIYLFFLEGVRVEGSSAGTDSDSAMKQNSLLPRATSSQCCCCNVNCRTE